MKYISCLILEYYCYNKCCIKYQYVYIQIPLYYSCNYQIIDNIEKKIRSNGMKVADLVEGKDNSEGKRVSHKGRDKKPPDMVWCKCKGACIAGSL